MVRPLYLVLLSVLYLCANAAEGLDTVDNDTMQTNIEQLQGSSGACQYSKQALHEIRSLKKASLQRHLQVAADIERLVRVVTRQDEDISKQNLDIRKLQEEVMLLNVGSQAASTSMKAEISAVRGEVKENTITVTGLRTDMMTVLQKLATMETVAKTITSVLTVAHCG